MPVQKGHLSLKIFLILMSGEDAVKHPTMHRTELKELFNLKCQ